MRNRHFKATAVSLLAMTMLLLSSAGSCYGTLIASYSFEESIGPEWSPFEDWGEFTFFYGPYSPEGEIAGIEYLPDCGVLMAVAFTSADVGFTYTVDSGAAFDVAADCLTNGILDSFTYHFIPVEGSAGPETSLWDDDYEWYWNDSDWGRITCYSAGSNGIDLQGFEIESISFRLDAYEPYYVVFAIEVHGSPAVTPIALDIKPGSSPNAINIDGNGVIPVAILGSAEFDVSQVDVDTLRFAGLEVRVKPSGVPQCSTDDVTGPAGVPDGYNDLVCQFVDDPELWVPGDDIATLTGNLEDGTPIAGSDEITVVP